MGVLWIRLDTSTVHIGWVSELPGHQFAAWVKLLALAKEAGRGGRVKREHITAAELRKLRVPQRQWEAMLAAAQAHAAVEIEDDHLVVLNWASYQLDRTNAERQADFRAKNKDKDAVTDRNGSNDRHSSKDVTDKTQIKGKDVVDSDAIETAKRTTAAWTTEAVKLLEADLQELGFKPSSGWLAGLRKRSQINPAGVLHWARTVVSEARERAAAHQEPIRDRDAYLASLVATYCKSRKEAAT